MDPIDQIQQKMQELEKPVIDTAAVSVGRTGYQGECTTEGLETLYEKEFGTDTEDESKSYQEDEFVEELGTHFNPKAYHEGSISTDTGDQEIEDLVSRL